VKSIAQERCLQELLTRLQRVTPESTRRWGTLTPGEMLCHLGDAAESVLGIRIPPGPASSARPRPVFKWLILYSPVPWPKGVQTRPGVDPRREGTKPSSFANDQARAINSLRELAVASADGLAPAHFRIGRMSQRDWRRWAYKHVDHHLRQFGE